MKNLEIYVQGENQKEPKLIEIPEDCTIADIVKKYAEIVPGIPVAEIDVYLEDDESPKAKDEKIDKAGVKKRSHIHCHRCKKIQVAIEYNGVVKSLTVPPSMTGEALLKKAAHEFNISGGDAKDLILRLPDGQVIGKTDHVGSYSSFPACSLKLELIHNNQVKG